MAVAPITQPTAAGIDPVDYSPWSQPAQARSALPGILHYAPNANLLPAPTASPTFLGGTPYGNYVRQWPDLMAAFQDPNQTGPQNISDWGMEHWRTHGQWEPARLAAGRPEDLPVSTAISLGDTMDTGGARVSVGTSGLPMPDVEGYKYEYPIYSYDRDTGYSYVGSNTADIDEYPYYPYQPTGAPVRSRNNRVLIGVRLVPK